MTQKAQWTAVDQYFTDLLVQPDEALDGEDVIPGFRCSLRDIL